jgi:hypothetical protein
MSAASDAMKATSQHEFHPDAERLNAFAELALGQGERDEVLEHLAVCGRCRKVVALAREAAEAESAAEVAAPASRRPAIQANAWWKQWRVVWVPTAVVAAFAVASVSVYLRQVKQHETTIRTAKLAPNQGTGPAPVSPPAEQAKAAPPALPAPAPAAAKSPKARNSVAIPVERQRPYREPLIDRLQPLPPPAPPQPSAPVNLAPGLSGEGFLRGGAPAIYRSSASAQWQTEKKAEDREKQQAENGVLHGALFGAKAAPPPAPRGAISIPQAATESVVVTTAAPELETQTAESASFGTLQSALASKPVAARMASVIRLPGGQHAVSTVSSGKVVLAIDQDGALYISQDQGGTWERIIQQWTGRAVVVRRQPMPPAAAPVPEAEQEAKPASGKSEVSPSATAFELVNDKNQVWLSSDGLIWSPK